VLKRNVEHNGFQNVVLENVAASNESGSIRLYLTASAMEDSMIDAGQAKQAIDVKAVRLDDYFADSSEGLDVIKIDTEGAEAIILEGMRNILRKNSTLRLVMEYSPRLLKASGYEPEEVLTKLMGQGFEIQFFDEAGRALVDLPADSTSRLTDRLRAESTYANLFLRRQQTTR
jgi:FkbM family methyltransferase